MKERPIIFNVESVRAILEGKKSQTRRVVKPQPPEGTEYLLPDDPTALGWLCVSNKEGGEFSQSMYPWRKCPYGVPGDRLWVRETHYLEEKWDGYHDPYTNESDMWRSWTKRVWYAVDGEPPILKGPNEPVWIKRPSIFMYRWASRITLEVLDVRVERVQEIGSEDIIAEGIRDKWQQASCVCLFQAFRQLWNSINAQKGFGWDVNPWVWVIGFRVLEKKQE